MKCSNCQHEQDTGKFCGKCGNALTTQTGEEREPILGYAQEESTSYASAASPTPATQISQGAAEPNEHVEKVKETSKQYWNYLLQYLKNPGSILEHPSNNLTNALITITVFAFIFSLVVYKNLALVLQPLDEFGSLFSESSSVMPSFFTVSISTILFIALIVLLSAGSLFLVNKFAGPNQSFKYIISAFGTLLIPSTALLLVAYLLLMIGSMIFGNFLALVSLIFSLSVMPLYLITVLLKKSSNVIDSFYAFIAYTVLFSAGLSIVTSVFFDTSISRIFEEINYIRDGFLF